MHARKRRKEEGFTLVELIVVVAILGFLLSIAIPRYLTARTLAAQSATKANLHQLASAMELYMAEHPGVGTYPTTDANDANNAESWLKAYIPKAPVPPGGNPSNPDTLYQYAQLGGGGSYAIWDPNPYGGKVFAAGPGGAIGEAEVGSNFVEAIKEAVSNATGIETTDLDLSNRLPLKW
jgi:general secretion pathway protein G